MAKKEKKEKTLVCKRYNEVGDCVEWVMVGGFLTGRIDEKAKICAPSLAKQAEQLFREGKVQVRLK